MAAEARLKAQIEQLKSEHKTQLDRLKSDNTTQHDVFVQSARKQQDQIDFLIRAVQELENKLEA